MGSNRRQANKSVSPLYTIINAVNEFWTAFGIVKDETSYNQIVNCLMEESNEYAHAVNETEELDALIDIIYVALGAIVASGGHINLTKPPVNIADSLADQIVTLCNHLKYKNGNVVITDAALNVIITAIMLINVMLRDNTTWLKAFDEVHNANMTKLWSAEQVRDMPKEYKAYPYNDKFVVRREDGKIMKPPTFTPPDLRKFIPD
jgi:hypothetical protein